MRANFLTSEAQTAEHGAYLEVNFGHFIVSFRCLHDQPLLKAVTPVSKLSELLRLPPAGCGFAV